MDPPPPPPRPEDSQPPSTTANITDPPAPNGGQDVWSPRPTFSHFDDDDNTPPPYERSIDDSVDSSDLLSNLDILATAHSIELTLPITTAPPPAPRRRPRRWPSASDGPVFESEADYDAAYHRYRLHRAILFNFFTAISDGQDDAVRLFIDRGLVSPDVPSAKGETPLLAAVRWGNGTILCTLAGLGATVDGYGTVPDGAQRTPLQLAAALGRLPLVKVLREDLGADDGLVAPDGEIALRLAARGRHTEVVAYLPARRAGAGLRLRTAAQRGAARVWKILWRVGEALRVLFWECPKMLTYYPVRQAWRSRHRIVPWVKRQVMATPRRVKEGCRLLVEGARKGCRFLIQGIRKTPAALGILSTWVWNGVRRVCLAVAEAAKRVVAALHTVLAAAVDFFRRITLKDVWNGLVAAFRSLFVGLPRAVWLFLKSFGEMTWDALVKLGGTLGEIVWCLLRCLLEAVIWFPKQVWKILAACGRVVWIGVEEVLVLLNPKRVG